MCLGIVKSLKIDQIYRRTHYNTERNNDNIYKLPDTLYKSKNLCNEFEIHLKVRFFFTKNFKNLFKRINIFLRRFLYFVRKISKT